MKSRILIILKKMFVCIATGVLFLIVFSGFKEGSSFPEKAYTSTVAAVRNFVHVIWNDKWYGALLRDSSSSNLHISNNFTDYKDSLSLTGIQIYGYDSLTSGGFSEPYSNYISGINTLIGEVDTKGLKGYYGRSKIETPCYSQRLVYEAEGGNNGFSYTRHGGDSISDSGRTVIHMDKTIHSPGMLCDSIYENLQHGDFFGFTHHDAGTWFMRPVMRIDSSIYLPTSTDTVVIIKVINFQGNELKSIHIRVRDFGQGTSFTYKGQYLDIYPLIADQLQISGRPDTVTGLSYGIKDSTWWAWGLYQFPADNNKIDFKVYWPGKVDVWFDKMIVDDEMANQLFSGDFAGNYDNMILEASNNTEINYIILSDVSYSMFSAVTYIEKLIRVKTDKHDFKIFTNLSDSFFKGIRQKFNQETKSLIVSNTK